MLDALGVGLRCLARRSDGHQQIDNIAAPASVRNIPR
jgi:hypothetical protein